MKKNKLCHFRCKTKDIRVTSQSCQGVINTYFAFFPKPFEQKMQKFRNTRFLCFDTKIKIDSQLVEDCHDDWRCLLFTKIIEAKENICLFWYSMPGCCLQCNPSCHGSNMWGQIVLLSWWINIATDISKKLQEKLVILIIANIKGQWFTINFIWGPERNISWSKGPKRSQISF